MAKNYYFVQKFVNSFLSMRTTIEPDHYQKHRLFIAGFHEIVVCSDYAVNRILRVNAYLDAV